MSRKSLLNWTLAVIKSALEFRLRNLKSRTSCRHTPILKEDSYTIDKLIGLLYDAKVEQSLGVNRDPNQSQEDDKLVLSVDNVWFEVDFKIRLHGRGLVFTMLITSASYWMYTFL